MAAYEIQGRSMERDSRDRVVRQHVRLASAADRGTAIRIADEMAADHFTAWVFAVEGQSGRKTYKLLDTVPPR